MSLYIIFFSCINIQDTFSIIYVIHYQFSCGYIISVNKLEKNEKNTLALPILNIVNCGNDQI